MENKKQILITGSEGLIGTALREVLLKNGYAVKRFDLKGEGEHYGDVRNFSQLQAAADSCVGIIHLAAISRVVEAQNNPEECWNTNVGGILNVVNVCKQMSPHPWVIFAGSREVYGNSFVLPVKEDFPRAPINVYGKSKEVSEVLIETAIYAWGLPGVIVRFSNVYGGEFDHKDRVIPAFIHAALAGAPLRVEGGQNTFDFTYIEDVSIGVFAVVQRLMENTPTPIIHFVSGVPITLAELAHKIIQILHSQSPIVPGTPRNYDVHKFYGCPERAKTILNWVHQTDLQTGISILATKILQIP